MGPVMHQDRYMCVHNLILCTILRMIRLNIFILCGIISTRRFFGAVYQLYFTLHKISKGGSVVGVILLIVSQTKRTQNEYRYENLKERNNLYVLKQEGSKPLQNKRKKKKKKLNAKCVHCFILSKCVCLLFLLQPNDRVPYLSIQRYKYNLYFLCQYY